MFKIKHKIEIYRINGISKRLLQIINKFLDTQKDKLPFANIKELNEMFKNAYIYNEKESESEIKKLERELKSLIFEMLEEEIKYIFIN